MSFRIKSQIDFVFLPFKRPTILVDSLRKEFKEKSGICGRIRKKKKRTAISNTSFCVKKGEVLGLLGPNGAGKTTSVLILAGEKKPSAGQVRSHRGMEWSSSEFMYRGA
ncbi:hypothetical protein AB205_0059760 [Aquarana catesbeiana]|uniref:ABC transporter domain-containing protein n=1 Tax=Aquarana catesbeiana TaxID=8400 RepID=A0A2G9Q1E4_AQUCT|nr:hypothetical protein AB205_0059760 [Aquarana catesbeiana]